MRTSDDVKVISIVRTSHEEAELDAEAEEE